MEVKLEKYTACDKLIYFSLLQNVDYFLSHIFSCFGFEPLHFNQSVILKEDCVLSFIEDSAMFSFSLTAPQLNILAEKTVLATLCSTVPATHKHNCPSTLWRFVNLFRKPVNEIDPIINTPKKEAGKNTGNKYTSIITSASTVVSSMIENKGKYFMTGGRKHF